MLTEDDLPTLFTAADQEARRAQRRLFVLTAALLALALVAAIFGSFTIERGGKDWAAVGSLIALAGGLGATYLLGRWDPNKRWYDFRALAESSKSLSWLYAVGGGDFIVGSRQEQESQTDYLARLGDLRRQLAPDTPTLTSDPVAITDQMRQLRATTLHERRGAYRAGRLHRELVWYRRRAREHSQARTLWGWLTFIFQAAGFLFAFLRLFEIIRVDLVGIATTAAVAAAAWLRSHDHAGVAEAYSQTALELSEIEATVDHPGTEAEWATWVANAETAMSREHTSWRARRRRFVESG